MPENEAAKTFTSAMTVEWAHCDAAGIVFYPTFYQWFDQGTERLFKANGLGYADLERLFDVLGMPLVETGASYQNACRLGDELTMTTRVDEVAGRTLLVKHRVTHADGRPALEGFERRVMVVSAPESEKGVKAIAIPDEVITRLRA